MGTFSVKGWTSAGHFFMDFFWVTSVKTPQSINNDLLLSLDLFLGLDCTSSKICHSKPNYVSSYLSINVLRNVFKSTGTPDEN